MYKNKVYLMIASVIIIHLLLTRQVLGLYETIWNAYFEQPCCEKDFMKFHRGKRDHYHSSAIQIGILLFNVEKLLAFSVHLML